MTAPFRVLLADPPWSFGDKLPGKSRGAEKNYGVIDTAGICGFPIPKMAPDSILFLWRVSSQPEEALRVVRAWGFVPKSEIVWVKLTSKGQDLETDPDTIGFKGGPLHFGMGRYVRASHETCIIATRGKASGLVRAKNIRSVFAAPTGAHSQKPDVFYELIETMVDGPYAELFARRYRDGWTQWGDALDEPMPLDPETRQTG